MLLSIECIRKHFHKIYHAKKFFTSVIFSQRLSPLLSNECRLIMLYAKGIIIVIIITIIVILTSLYCKNYDHYDWKHEMLTRKAFFHIQIILILRSKYFNLENCFKTHFLLQSYGFNYKCKSKNDIKIYTIDKENLFSCLSKFVLFDAGS